METADHKKTDLHFYTEFEVQVENIVRKIKCFVGSESYDILGNIVDQYRLLLGLPWLYSVNAIINIRSSSILIGDTSIGEAVVQVTGPELVLFEENNLLMFSKLKQSAVKTLKAVEIEDEDSDEEESSDDSEDDLFDIPDNQQSLPPLKNFCHTNQEKLFHREELLGLL